ncbi:MAG: hypothetical protein HYR55_15870 [Acidobacteria bacterium]|nr:hypothetical protein [Acidobacteriota bacterium]MBI3656803.1 hypothetical protein [Acidobacteriota bacterium]
MVKRKKMWLPSPPRRPKSKLPETVKTEVERRANELVASVIKPKHVNHPPVDQRFNYLVDISTKWYRNYFYFYAKYHCPAPNAITPFFETGFARMEYVGDNTFSLSYMRHTEQWWEIYAGLSLDECLRAIAEEPHFIP